MSLKNREAERLRKLRRTIFRLVQGVEAGWKPADVTFSAARVVVAACFVGTDVSELAKVTCLPEGFVARVAARCRKERIWHGAKIRAAWDQDDIAFVCDALVAAGVVIRPPEDAVTTTNKQRRAKRLASGVCTACGRPRSSPDRRVCDVCRQIQKNSDQRKAERRAVPLSVQVSDPLYQIAPKGYPAESGALTEVNAADPARPRA